MPSSGVPVEDLGGPSPDNYRPDDDSAKPQRTRCNSEASQRCSQC